MAIMNRLPGIFQGTGAQRAVPTAPAPPPTTDDSHVDLRDSPPDSELRDLIGAEPPRTDPDVEMANMKRGALQGAIRGTLGGLAGAACSGLAALALLGSVVGIDSGKVGDFLQDKAPRVSNFLNKNSFSSVFQSSAPSGFQKALGGGTGFLATAAPIVAGLVTVASGGSTLAAFGIATALGAGIGAIGGGIASMGQHEDPAVWKQQ